MVWHLVWGLVAAVLGTAAVVAVWSTYRDEIIDWLARNNLQESALADACVILERICSRVKATVLVRRKTSEQAVRVSERTLSDSDLQNLQRDSPSVYGELMQRGLVRVNILKN
jgi:hypothetical protein